MNFAYWYKRYARHYKIKICRPPWRNGLRGGEKCGSRAYGRIRRYGQADVARVKFVKSAQRLGFSLDEVGQLLKLEDGTHCSEAAELAAHRLADVRARMADLTRMEEALSTLVRECNAHHGNVSCPLIAALHCC